MTIITMKRGLLKMKLYLKYCGGCNPLYDRSLVKDRFAVDFPELVFTREESEADRAAVICGCSRACAGVSEAYGGEEAVYITSMADYEEVKRKWKNV